MNIEKTMEFILDMQVKGEERWAKVDGRFAKFEKTIEFILHNQAKAEERFAKSRIDTIRAVAQERRTRVTEVPGAKREIPGENG